MNLFLFEYETTRVDIEFHSHNIKGNDNPKNCDHESMPLFTKPTASMIYLPLNKPSNGCMKCVATPSNPDGSMQSKQVTLLAGHFSMKRMCKILP